MTTKKYKFHAGNVHKGDRILNSVYNKWGIVDYVHSKYVMITGIRKNRSRVQVYYSEIVATDAMLTKEMGPVIDELESI